MNLFDDDDGQFMGTPKSKFFDILYNINRSIAEDELEMLIERLAILEMMVEEHAPIEDLERYIKQVAFDKSDEVENRKISFFIESMGSMVTRGE